MIEYPKIETLYARDPRTFKVVPGALRLSEYGLIARWLVTEKVDGTNIRVHLKGGSVTYGGRTEAAQLFAPLVTLESTVAREDGGSGCVHEGIVARTEPMLFTRRGDRVIWKLKGKDFGA